MGYTYSGLIKDLRQKKGLSQLELSKKLGISRPSLVSLEKGTRELSLSEAEKLSEILGVSLGNLLDGKEQNIEKYKQMLFAFLRSGISNDGKVPKTKLAKLLYLADFAWYYDHMESMSGMPYRKITYGPVPDTYFRIVEELYESGKLDINKTDEGAMLISETKSGQRELVNLLDKNEKKLIKEISKKWRNKRTQEIVDFAHNQLPYKICSDGEIIPYELITQEDPEYVY